MPGYTFFPVHPTLEDVVEAIFRTTMDLDLMRALLATLAFLVASSSRSRPSCQGVHSMSLTAAQAIPHIACHGVRACISAMYPPGNATMADWRSSSLKDSMRTVTPPAFALESVSERSVTS
jgi:hypothetical protein